MIDQQQLQQLSRLGAILTKRNYITEQQLVQALAYQQAHNLRLGEALLDLGYIDQNQLTRALKRQSWVRSLTASLALVMAPFSPAFAVNPGNSGKQSRATAEITLQVLPHTLLNGDDKLVFKSNQSEQMSPPLCPGQFNSRFYHVSAAGSGERGQFQLNDLEQHSLDYQVSYHSGQQEVVLQTNRVSNSFINADAQASCAAVDLTHLKVALAPEDQKQVAKDETAYSGTLTITFAAE